MSKSRNRILLYSFLAFFVLAVAALFYINPKGAYRLDKDRFDIPECKVTTTEHITACGMPAEIVEYFYLALRDSLGVQYVDKHLEIYVARPIMEDGIGYINGVLIAGVYHHGKFGNDIIVFNGTEITLIHELSHYFFQHMKGTDKHEVFARLSESQVTTTLAYQELAVQHKRLIELFFTYMMEQYAKQKENKDSYEKRQYYVTN